MKGYAAQEALDRALVACPSCKSVALMPVSSPVPARQYWSLVEAPVGSVAAARRCLQSFLREDFSGDGAFLGGGAPRSQGRLSAVTQQWQTQSYSHQCD